MAVSINGTSGISGVDGSTATPALQGTDSNTGISFGADTVNVNVGGKLGLKVDSNQNVSFENDGEGFHVIKRTGTLADDDWMGAVSWRGNNSASEDIEYVKVFAQVKDVTDATEDGALYLATQRAGTVTTGLQIISGYVNTPGNPGVYLDALDWTSSNNYMHNGYQFWQVGNHWNNTTGTFTCPIAGKYFVAADAQAHSASGGGTYANLIPRKNNADYGLESVATTASGGSAHHAVISFAIVMDCAVNDTIRVYSNHSFRSNTQNKLCIYLIG